MYLFNFYRGANLSKEDFNSFTPLLTAAAHKQTEAFHCLMQHVDLSSNTENPAFKVLSTANYNSEILQVRHWTKVLLVQPQYFLKHNIVFTSHLAVENRVLHF